MSSGSEDSAPEEHTPPPSKKSKPAPKKPSSKKEPANDEKDGMLDIGYKRYITVSEFKGKKRVDIREYYNDRETGELKPGKKGISLSVEDFKKLEAHIPKIKEMIEQDG